jgi:hypothetical protein
VDRTLRLLQDGLLEDAACPQITTQVGGFDLRPEGVADP